MGGCTNGQFTAAVLSSQPAPFCWWNGGHLASETNAHTYLRAHERQTDARGYSEFYVLHQLSVLDCRFLPSLTMTENMEKDYFGTEKMITELG